ncbi:septation protein SepH [Jatrophihabitans sp. DSM 45814]
MRELHFVGPGDDGTVIVQTADGAEQFSLLVDERLVRAAHPDTAGASGPAGPSGGPTTGGKETMIDIRPRDIQMRVRAGEEAQTLADEAGVPLDRIMRFAYPVLQERIRVVDEARRGRARNGDGQTVDFGELFDHRVAAIGTEPSTVVWNSFRRPDGGWTVVADFIAPTFSGDHAPLLAKFSFALLNRSVAALNDVAADLLTGRPLSVLRAPAEPERASQVTAEDTAPARDSDGDPDGENDALEDDSGFGGDRIGDGGDDAAGGTVDAPAERTPLAVVAPPPSSHSRSPLRLPSRRQRAHTHPIPVPMDDEMFDDLFDQDAADPAGNGGWHEPPLPLDLGANVDQRQSGDQPGDPSAATDEPAADQSGGDNSHRRSGRAGDKPRMPSWDDILLGVRRKSD